MERGVKRIYDIERYLYIKRIPFLPQIVKMTIRVLCSATIPYTCTIGNGTIFPHGGQGVILHDETVIGKNCVIQANVIIGGRNGLPGAPLIGDNVLIGAGAAILGNIRIGNNVSIGANAVVLQDINDNSVAVGVPARVITREKSK